MKFRGPTVPCSAVSPVHQTLALPGEPLLCIACVLLLYLSHLSLQSRCLHWFFACCGLCMLSVLLVKFRQFDSRGCDSKRLWGWGCRLSNICTEPLVLGWNGGVVVEAWHAEAAAGWGMCSVNKNLTMPRVEARSLGVGWPSDELMGGYMVHRFCSKSLFSTASSRWLCVYTWGWWRKMTPAISFVPREVPQHATKSDRSHFLYRNYCFYVASLWAVFSLRAGTWI